MPAQPFQRDESATPEARSLEGRPLAMYSSLMFPDRSRLRLLDPRRRLAAAIGEQKRPMSGLSSFLARAGEGGGECGW